MKAFNDKDVVLSYMESARMDENNIITHTNSQDLYNIYNTNRWDTLLEKLKNSDNTIVSVSHSLGSIQKLCDRAIWIYDREVRKDGKTSEVIEEYLKVCG